VVDIVPAVRQLSARTVKQPISEKYGIIGQVEKPDPKSLGEHFGLLADGPEIKSLTGWMGKRLAESGRQPSIQS
jgi:hypothetical protein